MNISIKHVRVALLVAVGLMAPAAAEAQENNAYRERVDTSVTMEKGGTLSVSVYSGRVSVTGASGSTVHIRGTVERGEMDFRARPTSVTISTQQEGPHGGKADLDITVPTGTRVVLEGFSAPFTVRGVKGEAKVESLSGNVIVSDAVGRVNVGVVSGNIQVDRVKGDLRAEAVSGYLELTDIDGDIEAESVSGRIIMTGASSKSVRAETVSGSVGYSGTFDPSGSYTLKSHSGRVTMGLPADAGATVSLETFSGNVDSDFPVTLESGTSRSGHESRFEFRIGNGRSRIIAETFSGDIRIQRSTTRDNRE
ncbi:MAG: DUF4097 family beta strand repeat-containing protein [Gemmatimonadales bacterium]